MSKIKIVLRKEKKQKDGKMPLAIRITKDRKLSYIHLGVSLSEEQWDADSQTVKKHPNTKRLNHFLVTKLAEATDKALELETHKEYSSVKAVKAKIKPSVGSTFFPQMDAFVADLKAAGKYNQYTSDKSRLNRFKEYLKNDIAFQDITPSVLERFKSWLVVIEKVSERTAVNHLVSIRSVFSKAIRDEVIDARYYPFGKGKVKIKFPDSAKIGLTQEEVKKIEDAKLSEPFHNHVRNLWLISFYFAGMRVSDVLRLKWSDFTDSRLHYSMGKNKKGGSFKVHDKAQAILDKYIEFKTAADNLVFPELKDCDLTDNFSTQRTITFKTSAIDKCLRNHVAKAATVDKKLTMHIARHTVGNIARDKISIPILQKMFRHSSITTTAAYMANFKHEETDDALDMLIGEAQLTIAPKND
jgi:integrase/recombinase XerD